MTPAVLIDMQLADTRSALDEFLPRNATLTITGIPNMAERVDVILHFRSAHQGLYQYLPFNFHVAAENGIGEIAEVSRPDTQTRIEIHGVPLRNGRLAFRFQSECGGIPAHLGLGPDICELSMQLTDVQVKSSQLTPENFLHRNTLTSPWRMGLEDEARPPIFILGPYRSGTSITTWAVGQHPNIAPLEETGWVHTSLMALRATYRLANARENPASMEYDMPEHEFAAHMAASLNNLHLRIARRRAKRDLRQQVVGMAPRFTFDLQLERTLWAPKSRWVDGTPEQTLAARQLASAFDGSQFLVMVRDPALVMRSLAFFERAGGTAMPDEKAATHWLRYTAAGCDLFHLLGPDRVKFVNFDTLTSDTAGTMRAIFAFLGESHFAPAANTFRQKINSSLVDNEPHMPRADLLATPRSMYDRILSGRIPAVDDFNLGPLADFESLPEGCITSIQRALT